MENQSKFIGTWGGLFLAALVQSLMSIIPLIGVAMGICYYQRYIVGNTVVDGNRLQFDGQWTDLWWRLLLWGFLTVITAGIYGIFAVPVKAQRFFAEHTHFAD